MSAVLIVVAGVAALWLLGLVLALALAKAARYGDEQAAQAWTDRSEP